MNTVPLASFRPMAVVAPLTWKVNVEGQLLISSTGARLPAVGVQEQVPGPAFSVSRFPGHAMTGGSWLITST